MGNECRPSRNKSSRTGRNPISDEEAEDLSKIAEGKQKRYGPIDRQQLKDALNWFLFTNDLLEPGAAAYLYGRQESEEVPFQTISTEEYFQQREAYAENLQRIADLSLALGEALDQGTILSHLRRHARYLQKRHRPVLTLGPERQDQAENLDLWRSLASDLNLLKQIAESAQEKFGPARPKKKTKNLQLEVIQIELGQIYIELLDKGCEPEDLPVAVDSSFIKWATAVSRTILPRQSASRDAISGRQKEIRKRHQKT